MSLEGAVISNNAGSNCSTGRQNSPRGDPEQTSRYPEAVALIEEILTSSCKNREASLPSFCWLELAFLYLRPCIPQGTVIEHEAASVVSGSTQK